MCMMCVNIMNFSLLKIFFRSFPPPLPFSLPSNSPSLGFPGNLWKEEWKSFFFLSSHILMKTAIIRLKVMMLMKGDDRKKEGEKRRWGGILDLKIEAKRQKVHNTFSSFILFSLFLCDGDYYICWHFIPWKIDRKGEVEKTARNDERICSVI